jgi:hypothetical protein
MDSSETIQYTDARTEEIYHICSKEREKYEDFTGPNCDNCPAFNSCPIAGIFMNQE